MGLEPLGQTGAGPARGNSKWVPLIIAGPGYTTPKWYREGPLSFPYVCLEHHEASKIQSLWNPAWRAWVDRFVAAFADRYRDRGVLESVLIGSSGTYGETLYPAGPEDGWTYDIPGPFHNHLGWWAGDKFAVADFRAQLTKRYQTVAALNRAWKSDYATWDAVAPFIPDTALARARLDMVNWYVQSMTDWAAFMAATVRKHLRRRSYICAWEGPASRSSARTSPLRRGPSLLTAWACASRMRAATMRPTSR